MCVRTYISIYICVSDDEGNEWKTKPLLMLAESHEMRLIIIASLSESKERKKQEKNNQC